MLFKTSDKLKLYSQISGTPVLASLRSTIEFIENNHIVAILGQELFNTLELNYQDTTNEDDLSDADAFLLDKVRKVIGPLLCYYYAPKADVQLTDSGVQRIETTTNKTAYQYQNTNFAQANLKEGEACSEQLIEFLEQYQESYPLWVASQAFTKYRSLFIKSGKEFDSLYASHTPYRNFYAIRSKMFDVEEINIRDTLGSEMYDAIKVRDITADPNYTNKEKQLLQRVKKAIAYLSVAFSLPMLNVRIDSNGLSVVASSTFSQNEKENTRAGADDNARIELMKSCMASGAVWINNTIAFIKENQETFPTWKGFAVQATITGTSINTELTGSFGML